MFVWFWFPDYIFSALSTFNWIAWIAPTNFHLTAITGIHKGLGFNPFPTFDWNIVTHVLDPLIVPFHVTINTFFGVLLGGIVIIGMYWTNAYNTGYLPINTNSMFNHYGKSFNVSMILDDRGWLDESKYQAYSPVYLAASSLTMYFFSFAVYSALVSYAFLYHSRDISLGFKSLVQSFKQKEGGLFTDIHSKLISAYREGKKGSSKTVTQILSLMRDYSPGVVVCHVERFCYSVRSFCRCWVAHLCEFQQGLSVKLES